jgi:hypothetical protein
VVWAVGKEAVVGSSRSGLGSKGSEGGMGGMSDGSDWGRGGEVVAVSCSRMSSRTGGGGSKKSIARGRLAIGGVDWQVLGRLGAGVVMMLDISGGISGDELAGEEGWRV